MIYDSYYYHSSKKITTPRKSCGNIKGLELEISDSNASDILDELVEDGTIIVPETEPSNPTGLIITCEDDSSVYKELIFKASCNRTLLKGVKELSNKLNGEINNDHGTSCHIHINNEYLRSINVERKDIVKASEFLAPILYKISGRNLRAYKNWARSCVEDEMEIENEDLYERAYLVDNEVSGYHDARYRIVNLNPYKSTEIRIFSNYYNFNYDYIKMYIETVDFIIELAQYMKGKSYRVEYNNIIEMTKNFFEKRKYKSITEQHDLTGFFISARERQLRNISRQIEYTRNKIRFLKEITQGENKEENAIELLRFLRNYNNRFVLPNLDIDLFNFNLENIEELFESNLTEERNRIEEQE